MRFVAGVATVVLVSVGSAFVGQLAGHVASGDDKNAGLEAAFIGLAIGAAVAISALAWWGDRRKDWRPVLGGVISAAVSGAAIALLILRR